jgi:hypothetical protein
VRGGQRRSRYSYETIVEIQGNSSKKLVTAERKFNLLTGVDDEDDDEDVVRTSMSQDRVIATL